jgi:hypothetical protein
MERAIILPTAVEPVKAILSMPGWSTMACPVGPAPVTMLTTPGRQVGLSADLGEQQGGQGVVSAGLRTTVLPQASAGAIFHASMSSGKFHGMTCPTTPTAGAAGAQRGILQLVGPAGVVEEVRRRERDVDVAALLDRLAVVERLQDRELAGALLQERAIRKRYFPRSAARHPRPHPWYAVRAALTARSTSAAVASAISARAPRWPG